MCSEWRSVCCCVSLFLAVQPLPGLQASPTYNTKLLYGQVKSDCVILYGVIL